MYLRTPHPEPLNRPARHPIHLPLLDLNDALRNNDMLLCIPESFARQVAFQKRDGFASRRGTATSARCYVKAQDDACIEGEVGCS